MIGEEWSLVQVGSVGGAVYEYREQNGDGSERYVNPNFYEDILALSDSEHREIILICHSGYRIVFASKLLSDNGFSNVWHIVGGMNIPLFLIITKHNNLTVHTRLNGLLYSLLTFLNSRNYNFFLPFNEFAIP